MPDSIRPRNKLPGPTRCSCPTSSSSVLGRSLSASGATSARCSLEVLARFGVGVSSTLLCVAEGGGEGAARLDLNSGAKDLGSGPSFRFLEVDVVGLEDRDAPGLDFGVVLLVSVVLFSRPV